MTALPASLTVVRHRNPLELVLHVTTGRRDALATITDLSDRSARAEGRRKCAWSIISGKAANLKERGPQPNLGADRPGPGWWMEAVVLSAGCESWGANDAR